MSQALALRITKKINIVIKATNAAAFYDRKKEKNK